MNRRTTELLRTDEGDYWVLLRALLQKEGIDPSRAVLAVSFEDDNEEYGVLVTEDERVIEFEVSVGEKRKVGEFRRWNDLTSTWRDHHWPDDTEAALGLIREERSA